MAGKFDLKQSANGQFHFNLKAGNGQVILSSEMYTSKSGAENVIDSIRRNAPLDERFERKTSSAGDPYFVLKAGNGEIIGKSEMYSGPAAMENGIASVKTNAPNATVDDLT
jgi:uncharacterized protein YegP (UPF0339 family)